MSGPAPSILHLFTRAGGDGLPPIWVGPLLWLVICPLGELGAQASRRAYLVVDQLARSLTGRELSPPFGEPLEEDRPLFSVEWCARWLGIGVVILLLCWVIVGLAGQLAQERPIGMILRAAFGLFLFENLMVISQRLRNVWFFRRLAKRSAADAGSLHALQRQDPQMLYWTGLATYLQAALLLLAAWLVVPDAWLFGGVLGMLLRARRYRQSLRALPPREDETKAQGAS